MVLLYNQEKIRPGVWLLVVIQHNLIFIVKMGPYIQTTEFPK